MELHISYIKPVCIYTQILLCLHTHKYIVSLPPPSTSMYLSLNTPFSKQTCMYTDTHTQTM